jgi:alpha-1,6-mannosyltransferase
VLRVAAIGLASGALYLLGHAAQREIFRNGQRAEVAGEIFSGAPPDGSRLALELGVYWAATALLFALYAWVLILCRNGSLRDPRTRRLALGFPILFNVGLLFGKPYQSVDSLTYVAHGFMGAGYGINPYARAAAEVAYREETAELARRLASFGWLPVHGPSPYGALWTWVEVLTATLTGGVGGALFLTKVLVVGASLGCAALIWAILGRMRPEDQLLGTLLYLWNPLVLVEFAGEGHNDALMILAVLASLFFTVAARPALSVGAALLGVLVKYLPVIFAPAQAIYLWRTRRDTTGFLAVVLATSVFGLLLAAALYAPFWIGPDTFGAVSQQGLPFAAPTLNGVIYALLSLALPPGTASAATTQLLAVVFLTFVLILWWRARDASGLLRACAWISVFYLLVVSAGTWPWYAALPLALMALTPRGVFLPLALVLTFCPRLVAPASTLINNGFASWDTLMPVTTAISVTVPLAVLIPLLALHRRRSDAKQGGG